MINTFHLTKEDKAFKCPQKKYVNQTYGDGILLSAVIEKTQ